MTIISFHLKRYQMYFIDSVFGKKEKSPLEQVEKPSSVFYLMLPLQASIPTLSRNSINQTNP